MKCQFCIYIFLSKSADEWVDELRKHDVPIAKVLDLDGVFNDPQVLQRQMLVGLEHPKAGKVKQVGFPIKLSDTPCKFRKFAPVLGEDTEEILSGLGYSKKQIEELHERKVIQIGVGGPQG